MWISRRRVKYLELTINELELKITELEASLTLDGMEELLAKLELRRKGNDPMDSGSDKEHRKDKIEKMSHKEAVKITTLINKILTVIEVETDYTYQDVMRALDSIKKNYEKKGSDLLNNVSIQEVGKFGGLLN